MIILEAVARPGKGADFMVRLDVVSVGIVQNSADVVLVLRSEHTGQLLVMTIGPFEGRAIAMGMEKIEVPRPMTHDLLSITVRSLGAKVQKVYIRDFQDGTFFATLFLELPDGSVTEVDCRPSDGVALAVRTEAPVYCDPVVMALHGMRPEEPDEDEDDGDEDEEDNDDAHIH